MIKEFKTEDGLIIPAVTKEQMIEIDRIAVEETGPNLFQMMENAGRNLALSAIDLVSKRSSGRKILIFAGTGGNGGGGICAARHLLNHGYEPVLILSNEDNLQEVPAYQLYIYRSAEGKEISFAEVHNIAPDLVIDALIGYSLNSAPRGKILEMINFINNKNPPVLSLDIPTGVPATSGDNPGEFVKPEVTLTLALPKTGLYPEKCGKIILADIGIPKTVFEKCSIDYVSPFTTDYLVPVIPVASQ